MTSVFFYKRGLIFLCGLFVPAASLLAQAQDYPNRVVRIVVPYATGGATDLMARLLQGPLSKAIGQPVIVDNKPGAAGAIGTRQAAKSEADGYTLLLGNNGPHTVLPGLSNDVGYNGIADFVPVASLGTTPLLLIARGDLPASTLKEFIEYARSVSGGLAYASSGVGSMSHLAMELFLREARIKGVHVPYKGQAPTLQAILAGDVKFAIVSPSPTLDELGKSGRIRILGVSTPTVSPIAPTVHPIAEVVPGYSVEVWFCLFVPVGTPAPVIDKLRRAFDIILHDASVREGMRSIGAAPSEYSSEQLLKIMVTEKEQWASVIREKNIKAE